MKHFNEMTMIEQAEALIAQRLPDGTQIDLETAKDSLARIIPMLEDHIKYDNDILDDVKINRIRAAIKNGKQFTQDH